MNLILKTTTLTLAATTLLCGGALFLKRGDTMPQTQNVAFMPTADGVRAPEFPAGLSWFNTDKPLSIQGLRGKIVLLDFWTYGCINCLHIIPDLKKLEAKYGKELVVIGVHSAKFDHESKPENLKNAVMRYGLEHPVVSDKGMRIWSEYAVRAWPTLVLIDPNGRVVGKVAGEGNYDVLDRTIAKVAAESRANKTLNETPLKVALERSKVAPTPLYFPGKVRAANGRVFIADSSHNRIVISDANGQVQHVVGNGEAAWKDGDFASASFSKPQGIAVDGEKIYVADTNNHAIRLIDLESKTVKTIAGTGKQAAWKSTGGIGTQAAISSPWDVLKNGNTLYIAMAGPHQIWKMDLSNRQVSVFAGSGREARTDGSRADATFAQPSGLATNGRELFVADSESSAIRAISLGESDRVRTLAGGDLFDFGDVDAQGLKRVCSIRLALKSTLLIRRIAIFISSIHIIPRSNASTKKEMFQQFTQVVCLSRAV
jgi:thiol-disulfide isomerase/thioredoxin